MVKPKTGLLKITRLNEAFGVLRGLEVYLNGKKAGSIASGRTFEIEIPPAEYQVYVKMDWCLSQPFDFQLESGEILSLDASLNMETTQTLFYMIFGDKREFYLLSKSKRKNDAAD